MSSVSCARKAWQPCGTWSSLRGSSGNCPIGEIAWWWKPQIAPTESPISSRYSYWLWRSQPRWLWRQSKIRRARSKCSTSRIWRRVTRCRRGQWDGNAPSHFGKISQNITAQFGSRFLPCGANASRGHPSCAAGKKCNIGAMPGMPCGEGQREICAHGSFSWVHQLPWGARQQGRDAREVGDDDSL